MEPASKACKDKKMVHDLCNKLPVFLMKQHLCPCLNKRFLILELSTGGTILLYRILYLQTFTFYDMSLHSMLTNL